MIARLLWLIIISAIASMILADGPAQLELVTAISPTPEALLTFPISVKAETEMASLGQGDCDGEIVPIIDLDYEQQIVDLVNAARANEGRPPLKRTTELDEAARYHASDMLHDDYLEHDSYDRVDGTLIKVCHWFERIQAYYSGWRFLGENIAGSFSTPQAAFNAWMNSSGHRDNILNSESWEIGVGYYRANGIKNINATARWVQTFGRRSGIYPVVINREAVATDWVDVSLYLYGDWDEMRLRNDDDPWTNWQPFHSTLNWTLKSEVGENHVWAEMRGDGQTVISNDSIYLASAPTLDNLPSTLRFVYSIPDQRLLSMRQRVTPRNEGNGGALTWRITTSGPWFTASPLEGATPDSFWIRPTIFNTNTIATYTGALTVTVTNVAEVEGSPRRMSLTLQVIDSSFRHSYFPLIKGTVSEVEVTKLISPPPP